METLQIIVLAIVQGLTEFLPISSSAHLILVPVILHWPDQGLVFDVALHVGSLTAVMVYFRHEVLQMTQAWFGSVFKQQHNRDSRLAWWVIIGTIPAVIAGLLFKDLIENEMRSPLIIAWATIGFGLLLGWSDRIQHRPRDEYSLRLKDTLIVGLFQALALIPGTSRSGITMTAGLMLGLNRDAAARFSFLLSIPVIIASGLFKTRDLIEARVPVEWSLLLLAVALSALSAWACIHFFLKLINRVGMMPFVYYRLLLGVFLLYLFW
ncbi:MAG: undecaprenyl-diphosphate phosphatase [Gammaproteobacteria bacterium]|nr:undecaprenyl-diphosphate phosphatase [Gammaproteobacteria bacterium]MBL7000111.1 undecaprenyl-diphosphate phosphatase [Gammaproteobacteria bacterium]